jgi:hypothetical protein
METEKNAKNIVVNSESTPGEGIDQKDSLLHGFNWTVFLTTCVAIISTFNFGYSIGVGNLPEDTIRNCPDGLYYTGPFPSCIPADSAEW